MKATNNLPSAGESAVGYRSTARQRNAATMRDLLLACAKYETLSPDLRLLHSLVDLQHLSDQDGLNFVGAVELAREIYAAELFDPLAVADPVLDESHGPGLKYVLA